MKNISAVLFGTFVEYFDYALYGFAASHIALNFFPPDDPVAALLHTLLVFSLAALAKPLGAIVFGHVGDKWGRVACLRYSMLGIALPTTAIGLLPSYGQWGAVSTILLVLCRFLQGFLVAGEYDGVSLYVQEAVPKRLACFGNSLVCASSLLGICVASFALDFSTQTFSPDLGWRVPFLLAGILGFCVLMLRRSVPENQAFSRRTPVQWSNLFPGNVWPLIGVACLCGASGALYHYVFVFLPLVNPPLGEARSFALVLLLCATPVAGICADFTGAGRAVILWTGGVLIGLVTAYQLGFPPLSYYVISLMMPFATVGSYVVLTHSIAPGARYRILSLGHAAGSVVMSSTTPFVCLSVWHHWHTMLLPTFYAGTCLMLGLLGLVGVRPLSKPRTISA